MIADANKCYLRGGNMMKQATVVFENRCGHQNIFAVEASLDSTTVTNLQGPAHYDAEAMESIHHILNDEYTYDEPIITDTIESQRGITIVINNSVISNSVIGGTP